MTLPKIARAAKAIEGANLPVTVQVDGGITEETILRAAEAGATCFVAGSSVYGVDEALGGPEAAIASLRAAACIGQAFRHRMRLRLLAAFACNGAPHL